MTKGLSGDEPTGLTLGPIAADQPGLFQAFTEIVEAGEGFPQLPPLSRREFDDTWGHATVVVEARVDGRFAGAYYLRPNGPGLAAHIANAGYFVVPSERRQGVGRAMIVDSIARAPALGFDAIQFNFVFAANPSRRLYESLGWQAVGRVPAAARGEDVLIYWRAV